MYAKTPQILQGVVCWAEAHIKIARMTLTVKLDRNWSSFQLANSAPPLSVTDSAIAPSARIHNMAFDHDYLIHIFFHSIHAPKVHQISEPIPASKIQNLQATLQTLLELLLQKVPTRTGMSLLDMIDRSVTLQLTLIDAC